jgi:predicted Zn-dependent protease
MATVQPRLKKRPILPTDDDELRSPRRLLDPEISRLTLGAARQMLDALAGGDDEARLTWSDARLVIANSHGLRRSSASTEATLRFESGSGPGAGRAAASARRLTDLEPEALAERAAKMRAGGPAGELPGDPVPVLLSPEATVQWLNVLNAYAFSGRSFLDGTSFLARHRNIQVFDRKVNLRDDGTAPGLPFPFDFEGAKKRPLELIVAGQPSTPALNHVQSAQAGFEPTAQSVGGQDAFFSNLFLLPDETPDADLLAAADGGLRVGWLEGIECLEPSQLKVRMVARGVRRIANGELGEPLPDFVWHESLLGALARLRAIGGEPVVLAMPTTPLGGISAPALVLEEASGFQAISS